MVNNFIEVLESMDLQLWDVLIDVSEEGLS
jgi:hypothetical protein